MTFGLDWLNDVAKWLAQWMPHWDVCDPTHAGVRFRARLRRKPEQDAVEVSVISPGLYVYWPLTTRVYVVPVVRQSVDLPAQSLTTRDGKSLLVSITLIYTITDIIAALTQNYDVGDTIKEIGSAAAVRSIVTRTWSEVRASLGTGDIDRELKTAARRLLKTYGVQVIDARITDCAIHTALRVDGTPMAFYPQESTNDA